MNSGRKDVVVLAADHNGVKLKESVKSMLKELGYICVDLGPYRNDVSVDYVDYAYQLGTIIKNKEADKGILICGTGVGMSIAVNKVEGVRAALVHNIMCASKSREHNDSNVLCLGDWVQPEEVNKEIVLIWMNEKFGEYRHVKRVEKLVNHPEENIVLANGCFDIVHKGHIEILRFAKSLGGKLVVAMNSDESVRRLKGTERPINKEYDRKSVLQSIKYVDEVVIFDEDKPTELIKKLRPNVVVKGGEWTAEEVRRRDEIPDDVQVKIFPLLSGHSSTNIIKSILKE